MAASPASAAQERASGPTVYAATDDLRLFALDAATGELAWMFDEFSGDVDASPIVVDGVVYLGDNGGTLYALDAATGSVVWTYDASTSIEASVSVVDGRIYAGVGRSIVAIEADTGEEIWTHGGLSGNVDHAPVVGDGRVYVGTMDSSGEVVAVDAEAGSEAWRFTDLGQTPESPAVADGTVYFGSNDRTLYALDGATGNVAWKFEEPDSQVRSPTHVDGTLYVTCGQGGQGSIYAVDADTGESRWAESLQRGSPINGSPAVGTETIYVGSYSEALHALDRETGERRWDFDTPSEPIRSTPTVFDGTVYLGSDDRSLYAVDAESGEAEWTFEQPTGEVRSAPTVVADPSAGHSLDSRVLHGTLNHHDLGQGDVDVQARVAEASAVSGDGGDGGDGGNDGSGDGLPGPGIGGAIVALLGAGYILNDRGTDERRDHR